MAMFIAAVSSDQLFGLRGSLFVAAPGFHENPQDGIHSGLVAAPLFLEPINNIGIEADGQLLLGLS